MSAARPLPVSQNSTDNDIAHKGRDKQGIKHFTPEAFPATQWWDRSRRTWRFWVAVLPAGVSAVPGGLLVISCKTQPHCWSRLCLNPTVLSYQASLPRDLFWHPASTPSAPHPTLTSPTSAPSLPWSQLSQPNTSWLTIRDVGFGWTWND